MLKVQLDEDTFRSLTDYDPPTPTALAAARALAEILPEEVVVGTLPTRPHLVSLRLSEAILAGLRAWAVPSHISAAEWAFWGLKHWADGVAPQRRAPSIGLEVRGPWFRGRGRRRRCTDGLYDDHRW